MKKATSKKQKKMKSRKAANGRLKATASRPKSKSKSPQRPRHMPRADERRASPRISPKSLWVTEYSSDYQFTTKVRDISEGGIFLNKRVNTASTPSLLVIPMGKHGTLNVAARPVYDHFSPSSYGTGYEFMGLTDAQSKALKNLLRNLD